MTKVIIVMRHADDEQRNKITALGIQQIKSVVGQMKDACLCPDIILAGNYPRMLETAKLIVDEFGMSKREITVRQYDDFLERMSTAIVNTGNEHGTVLSIGSMPDVMKAARWLVSGMDDFVPAYTQALVIESPHCEHWHNRGMGSGNFVRHNLKPV